LGAENIMVFHSLFFAVESNLTVSKEQTLNWQLNSLCAVMKLVQCTEKNFMGVMAMAGLRLGCQILSMAP